MMYNPSKCAYVHKVPDCKPFSMWIYNDTPIHSHISIGACSYQGKLPTCSVMECAYDIWDSHYQMQVSMLEKV